MTYDFLAEVEHGEFFAMDVEGDGERGQRPVEISLVRFSAGSPVEEFHWLVNPGRPISPYVTALHGITDAMVASAPYFPAVRDELAGLLDGAVVAAHGIRDDWTLLAEVMPEAPLLPRAMFDTQRFGRNVMPGIGRYNLDSLCAELGIGHSGESRGYPVRGRFPFRGAGRHHTGVDAALAGKAAVAMAARVDRRPKTVRHVNQAVSFVLPPRRERELRDMLGFTGDQAGAPVPNV